jgi:hypothetical protein
LEKLLEVFRLGLPIGMTMIFEAMLFNSATLIMGTFGTASVAAHQIALNVPSITFMVPLGIGMAATVRVGLAAGAGDGEAVRRAGYTAILMGAAFMCVTAVLLWIFPEQIATLYLANSAAKRRRDRAGRRVPARRRGVPDRRRHYRSWARCRCAASRTRARRCGSRARAIGWRVFRSASPSRSACT